MPARINRMHSEQVRLKIQAAVLIDLLQKCATGERDMTPTQLAAANSLLDRSVPKLQQIQHSGDKQNPVFGRIELVPMTANESAEDRATK